MAFGGEFEWDEAKNAANIAKHGIDFEDAAAILLEDAWVEPAAYRGEERFLATGPIGGRLYTVIYTFRQGNIRIISARRARTHERRAYRQAHGGSAW
ncbi:BrnT family toxin [Azospirillum sp.]|uniref:BrnT family toxin n=1 Tax=Azospirillum sp. TaxID=34012 RepID=UPI002D71E436|nr:BrnT family toxin [Azospirillum sp.]HYD67435.1 BrnT family toxin [Azospirillum sp.]